jgi:hypothetical protein
VDTKSGSVSSILGFAFFMICCKVETKMLNFCISANFFAIFCDQLEKAFSSQPLWVLF